MRERVVALSHAECLAGLASTNVGRIGVTAHALPLIVPITFSLRGNAIVFRTEPGGLLATACDGAVVAFEVDDVSANGQAGWSVLVVGVASLLAGSEAVRATELQLVSGAGPRSQQFVSIAIGQLTGRRVGPAVPQGRDGWHHEQVWLPEQHT